MNFSTRNEVFSTDLESWMTIFGSNGLPYMKAMYYQMLLDILILKLNAKNFLKPLRKVNKG